MQFSRIYFLLFFFVYLFSGCSGSHRSRSTTLNPAIPYHVWITLKNEKTVVDRIMTMCNLAQKPNKMQVSYPASIPGSIMLEYAWNQMDPRIIAKIKKACAKEPKLISIESE
jgi:hypothetical protein